MQAVGANGSNLQVFCTAVAAGIVESIVGKTFTTTDVGLIVGIGVGVGLGITSLSPDSMVSTALSLMHSQGSNAPKMMASIMTAVVTHLASATLSTADSSVFQGNGTIVIGSISVLASEMGGNIDTQLKNVGANGSNTTELAIAIGTGICTNILSSGTGITTITGTFTGPTPPGPIPGVGVGVGTIS